MTINYTVGRILQHPIHTYASTIVLYFSVLFLAQRGPCAYHVFTGSRLVRREDNNFGYLNMSRSRRLQENEITVK